MSTAPMRYGKLHGPTAKALAPPSRESHEVGVANQPGPAGMSANIAYCTCGWRGDCAYAKREEAQVAADKHALEGKR